MFRRETFDIFEEPLDGPGLADAPVSLVELASDGGRGSEDFRSTEDSTPVAAFTATDRPSSAETAAADPRRFSAGARAAAVGALLTVAVVGGFILARPTAPPERSETGRQTIRVPAGLPEVPSPSRARSRPTARPKRKARSRQRGGQPVRPHAPRVPRRARPRAPATSPPPPPYVPEPRIPAPSTPEFL